MREALKSAWPESDGCCLHAAVRGLAMSHARLWEMVAAATHDRAGSNLQPVHHMTSS